MHARMGTCMDGWLDAWMDAGGPSTPVALTRLDALLAEHA